MKGQVQSCIMPFPIDQVYNLVANVNDYPEFLPWCSKATVHKQTPEEMVADLSIGYGMFNETFTSHVKLKPHDFIEVECTHGPLDRLTNTWEFKPHGHNQTEVFFTIEYQFKNRLMQMAMDALYPTAFAKMTDAFEKRAKQLYWT